MWRKKGLEKGFIRQCDLTSISSTVKKSCIEPMICIGSFGYHQLNAKRKITCLQNGKWMFFHGQNLEVFFLK